MKTAEQWVHDYYVKHTISDDESQDGCRVVPPKEQWIKTIQVEGLNTALSIADTFALNHKLSAQEVIVAIQIRDAIERLVKEIEK